MKFDDDVSMEKGHFFFFNQLTNEYGKVHNSCALT